MAINTEAPIGLRETMVWRSHSATPIIGGGTMGIQYGSTAAIASSVAETTLWDTTASKFNGTLTIPAGGLQSGVSQYGQPDSTFATAGSTYRVTMFGNIGNTGTPTIRIRAALNAAGPVQKLLSDSTAVTMSTITGAGTFWLQYVFTVSAYSASVGSVKCSGTFHYSTAATGTMTHITLPYTSLGSLDLTVALAVDTTIQWGTNSGSNTITCTGGLVEFLG